MKKIIVLGVIAAFAFWFYKVPLDGKLPRLGGIKSKLLMKISSTAFTNGGEMPVRLTCDGVNINPELEFSGVPPDAKSLALIMDDPDAPAGTFTHWVVYNIDPKTASIPEGVGIVPGVQAKNSAGLRQYTGPCPPSGVHRYYFKLYALDSMLPPDEILDKNYLEQAIRGHIMDQTEIMGKYARIK